MARKKKAAKGIGRKKKGGIKSKSYSRAKTIRKGTKKQRVGGRGKPLKVVKRSGGGGGRRAKARNYRKKR